MDQGKKFIMDVAQIPKSEGIDIERWMYYFKSMGIAFVNSFEEGRKGTRVGQIPTFNQFQSIDLSLANTIQQYINTLDYIKQQIAFISGVTPQRLGSIENRELVGNVERSVQQSALITEYLFDSHDEVKRRAFTALIECAKIAYRDGKKVQYVLDDMGVELLELDEMELENSEFNVFVSNAAADHQFMAELKDLSRIALQAEKADLSTIMDTMVNNSPRDIIRTLQRGEQEAYKRLEQQQQQAMQVEQMKTQAQQQAVQAEMEQRQLDRDLKQYEIDTNNETKIMVAEINALTSKEGPSDMDMDGIPDPVEMAKISLQERDMASKAFLEHNKTIKEQEKHKREAELKERDLVMRKEIEDKKIKAIDVQNKSQEKMQKDQMANDEKQRKAEAEMERKRLQAEKEMHEKELKLKEKELKLKEKENQTKERIEQIKLKMIEKKAQADEAKHKMDMKKGAIDLQKKKQAAAKPAQPKKPKK
jgi:hypothetical protein